MFGKRTLDGLEVKGRRVLVRCDFNVPLNPEGGVRNDYRLVQTLPTLRHLSQAGAVVIAASHLGRPNGVPTPKYSLRPVAERLSTLLERPVAFVPASVGARVAEALLEAGPGDIVLLENLRFNPGEQAGDYELARELASPADLFVQDAYAVCHREHASVVGVPTYLPGAAGRLLQQEVEALSQLLEAPEAPYLALLGGAKVATKLPLLERLAERLDGMAIGGAMAYPFLVAQGGSVGNSRCREEDVQAAARVLELAQERNLELLLPEDHVHATSLEAADGQAGSEVPEGRMGVDIGPATRTRFSEWLSRANTIFWNGPLGVVEHGFSEGTAQVARALADGTARVTVGGGDTADAVLQFELTDHFHHVSTGGGATLKFLQGSSLPGLDALPDA